jgi:two-component system sensor histidine kinase KdpD
MPSAIGLYLPLHASDKVLGVLGVLPRDLERHFSLEEITYLETFASLFASALERVNAAAIAEKSRIETEGEKLRNILLSSVSHDLRTPLASITGASSTIVMDGETLPRDTIRDLGRSINKEATRLSRIVTNLLDVTSLESGTVHLNSQPYYIEELIGSARVRLESALATHKLITNTEPNLPMVVIDGVLVEQVLANLLENATKYTPPDSTITIDVHTQDDKMIVSVSDNGKGIQAGEEKRLFDKFYTASQQDSSQKGTGLGLAICQGIITAHHGEIWAENLATGGARFSFTLPIARNAA